MKNFGRIAFLCGSLRVFPGSTYQAAFIISDLNRTIRRCLFVVHTSDRDYVIFRHVLLLIL